jgi:tyrosine-protein kinase Etk/Wzc
MNNEINQIKEEKVDIKNLLFRYYNHWYYFVFSLFFFTLIAFAYIRYTTPVYSVSSTILIRDDNNTQLGAENILEGMELFSGKTNINNEIVVLKSFSLINQVIDELGLGVSYFQHGFLQSNELFQNTPFIVKIDSNYNQISNKLLMIKHSK